MKKIISTLFVFGIIILNAGAQAPANEKQIKAALHFINLLRNQEFDKCWNLMDKKVNPDSDKEKFMASIKDVYESFPDIKDEFELYMSGIKLMDGKEMVFYSFKYKTDIAKPAPQYRIDVVFAGNKSTLVAWAQYKKANIKIDRAASSKGLETEITTRETWVIDSTEYKIVGVNIVHFTGNAGLLVVQVEQIVPGNVDQKTWACREGIKFAKYLYKTDAYQKGVEKAKELNVDLHPDIGVSFIDPATGQGYNVMIKAADYQ